MMKKGLAKQLQSANSKIMADTFQFSFMGQRFAIKKGLIIMKLCYFTYNFGAALIFPFIPLQMTDLGLTIEDIGYIYGLYPLITMFSGPISGFIGDKLGYRVILIVYILISGATATAFHFVPRCGEHQLQPHALLYSAGGGEANRQYSQLVSVNWALCDIYDGSMMASKNSSMSSSSCTDSLSTFALQDLPRYLNCTGRDNNSSNDVSISADFSFYDATAIRGPNGTFCSSRNEYLSSYSETGVEGQIEKCFISNHPDLELCTAKYGSHKMTFWTYFGLRLVFQWAIIGVFSIFDGASVQLANEHGGTYSEILKYALLAAAISTFLPSLVMKKTASKTEGYELLFYINDGFIVATALFVLGLKVKKIKTGEQTLDSLKMILTKPALLLYGLVAVFGFGWGVENSFLAVYLQESMHATTRIISYAFFVSSVVCFLVTFVAQQVVNRVGPMNVIYLAVLVQGVRLIIYSLVIEVPPYYAIGLFSLDLFTMGLGWIAIIMYAYTIAPPDLVATMTAVVNTLMFVICKGLGSFTGGQLEAKTPLTMPQVFRGTGGISAGVGLVLIGAYHLTGKRWEANLVTNKENLLIGSTGILEFKLDDED